MESQFRQPKRVINGDGKSAGNLYFDDIVVTMS